MKNFSLMLILMGCMMLPFTAHSQNFYTYGGAIINNTTNNCFTLEVTGVGNLSATDGLMRVCLSIDQARPADMDISLTSPQGVTVSLSTDNGGTSGNDYYQGVCFSDCGPNGPITAGSNFRGVYSPENSLSGFNTGANGSGTWTLCIDDDNISGVDGVLNYFSLDFGTNIPPSTPSGEDCANALVLSQLPFSHTCMSLAGYANDYNSCTGMMGGADYLYTYTPAGANEYLSIDIAQDYFAPSGFPTVVLLDTCPDVAMPANCIQTEIQMNSSENILRITSQPLTQGKTYFIVAASTSGTGGTYDMRIASGINGNDDCFNATVIDNTGEYAGNNYTATEPSLQAPSTAEMTCNGSIDNFVFYTFTTDATGSTVYVSVTDIDCDLSCGGSCGIQLALFEEPVGGACLGAGTWGPPVYCESSTASNVYYAWSGLSPSTRYYLMVDGNAGSKCVWNLRADGDFVQTLLPVDFLSVDVRAGDQGNIISWETANETNIAHFEVEHATDLSHFEAVGRVGSGAPADYVFHHAVDAPGMHFYRIRNVDLDGRGTYSEVVSIMVADDAPTLQLFPNPATSSITLSIDFAQSAQVTLMDLQGRVLGAQKVDPDTGFKQGGTSLRQLIWDVEGLKPGIYLFKVVLVDGRVIIGKFGKN